MKWTELRRKTHIEEHGASTGLCVDGLEMVECEYKEHKLWK